MVERNWWSTNTCPDTTNRSISHKLGLISCHDHHHTIHVNSYSASHICWAYMIRNGSNYNILSLSRLCLDNNPRISFFSNSFIKDLSTNQTILNGQTNQGVYICSLISPVVYLTISSKYTSSTWHHRLGHLFTKVFNLLSTFLDVPPSTPSLITPCNDCQVNKSHKLAFYNSTLISIAPLDLIFYDVWTSPILSYDHLK